MYNRSKLLIVILMFVCLVGVALIAGCSGQTKFVEPRAYICHADSGLVSVYNPSKGTSIGEIQLSNNPSGVIVSHDGNFVYINDGSSIAIVNARTNQIINNITTSHPTTGYLAISPDNSRLYVICSGGMSVIALADSGGNEIAFIDGITAMGIRISPDGKYVYTTDWGNCSLDVISTDERKIIKKINLVTDNYPQGTIRWNGRQVSAAGQAVGLDISPDGRHAVVGIWGGSFAPVVDLRNLTLEKAIPLNGKSYQCVAYSPDGSRIYISHFDGKEIMVLNGESYELIGTLKVAYHPKNIVVSPDGKYLYVAFEESKVEILNLPEGGRTQILDFAPSKSGENIAFNPAAA